MEHYINLVAKSRNRQMGKVNFVVSGPIEPKFRVSGERLARDTRTVLAEEAEMPA